jgi:N-acetylmuramoyl-L-alanine amidase
LAFDAVPTEADARRPGIWFSGKEYVQLADWAKGNGFLVRWLKRDESLQLSSPSAKLLLNVDSCDAYLNGVGVRLLFPVLDRNGIPFLSQLDAQTTLHPLLYPSKYPPNAKIKTIYLDPGHGGKDPGFQVGPHDEKVFNLLLAQELRDQLTRAGFKVSLTRTRDTSVELPVRPEFANRHRADLFVSLHFNAFPSSPNSASGVEVYCLTPVGAPSSNAQGQGAGAGWFPGNQNNDKNIFLAYQLQKSLTQSLGADDRGLRRARYWVLRDATMPAVLNEGGFMSHPVEGKKIFDPAYRRQMAHAITDGILAYKRILQPTATR